MGHISPFIIYLIQQDVNIAIVFKLNYNYIIIKKKLNGIEFGFAKLCKNVKLGLKFIGGTFVAKLLAGTG